MLCKAELDERRLEKTDRQHHPLLDAIIKYIPGPQVLEGTPQMLITSLDYSSYVGRIAIGRVHRGELREGMEIGLCKKDGSVVRQRIKELHTFEGMGRRKVESVKSGDICALVGIEGFEIGDTVTDPVNPEPLERIAIDELQCRWCSLSTTLHSSEKTASL